ncbi:serine hydrolase domain-containing protein [uncultured Flavobacterium sp.]|uniref:serine hydrolase domain-containing protein n=1 Tax=uncultured Flavobacterium sp. TaxID=165435 RepID=UPI0030ED7CD4|tara:strand:+ start:43967 stop:45028 length:1062 start_codon:yes stop_codon:yes gene_type:complete
MKTINSLLILVLTTQFAFAQSRATKVDSICQAIAKINPDVVMSIGFVDNGKEYFFNYGKISRNSETAVDENTVYEIGSVTKLLTGNLIAQAANEGKLKTDDFIDNYLPKEYKLSEEIKGKIKISDLASHQSGLPDFDFKKLMEANPKQPLDIDLQKVYELINENTTLTDYGQYRYSNINFVIMGMILEKVYHKNYDTILREKILNPLKMNQTLTKDYNIKNKIVGYDLEGVEQDFLNWNPIVAPAGLIKSNTADMTKLLKALLSKKGEIAKATTITEQTYYKTDDREMAFGQQIERNGKDSFFYKTGNTLACSSILAYDKNTNWGMIILLNQSNSKLIAELINSCFEQALLEK